MAPEKKNYNQGKCLNNNFYGCFTRRTSFLIFITAHTQKKEIDKVFLFIFYWILWSNIFQLEGTFLETIKSMVSAWNRTLAYKNTISFQTLHVVNLFFCCVLMWWLMYCLNSTIICGLTRWFIGIPWFKNSRFNKSNFGWLAPKLSFSYFKIRPIFQLFSNNVISCIINIQR